MLLTHTTKHNSISTVFIDSRSVHCYGVIGFRVIDLTVNHCQLDSAVVLDSVKYYGALAKTAVLFSPRSLRHTGKDRGSLFAAIKPTSPRPWNEIFLSRCDTDTLTVVNNKKSLTTKRVPLPRSRRQFAKLTQHNNVVWIFRFR
jgi:hypothetical protein